MRFETFLDKFLNLEKSLTAAYPAGLVRMRHLLALCGDPQSAFPCVLIAGSKGKGSTAAMVASVFQAAGWRTGLYTSPHLSEVNERIRVDGRALPPAEAAGLAARLEALLAKNPPPHGEFTYFEVLTAAAFVHFRDARVDAAVIEVGLGGEHDATNACEPLVSVITPLGYEHQAVLGNTLAEIASAKCGILRRHGAAVIAPQTDEAADAIRRHVALSACASTWIGRDVHVTEEPVREGVQAFWVDGPWGHDGPFEIPLLGRHQIDNAATAYAACRRFGVLTGRAVPAAALREGLARVFWPGRIERSSVSPHVVMDGAHTRESAAALAAALERHFKFDKIVLVLGMMRDKDPDAFVEPFLKAHGPCGVIAVGMKSPRAFTAPELAGRLAPRVVASCATDLEEALASAERLAGPAGLVVVTGSLYLVGEARGSLVREAR